MCLQERYRCLLLGLLVLGCVWLAYTPAAGEAREDDVTWSGEGTIRAEYNADKVPPKIPAWRGTRNGVFTMRGTRNGVFTITFKLIEAPGIAGPVMPCSIKGWGTATVTDTEEYTLRYGRSFSRCTGRLQATITVSVSGVMEGNMLKLKLLDAFPLAGMKPTPPRWSWSCTPPALEKLFARMSYAPLMSEDAWIEVAAEDGATGELDVLGPTFFMRPPGSKGRAVLSMRIKAPPDERFVFPCCYYEVRLQYVKWLRDAWSAWVAAGGPRGASRDTGDNVIAKPDLTDWGRTFSAFPGNVLDLYEDYPGCVDPWDFLQYGIPTLIHDYEKALTSCSCGAKKSKEESVLTTIAGNRASH